MFGPDLRDWIRRLEPARAVSFVRSLLIAEANRLQSPPEVIRMSGNVFAKDRGVDARSDLPVLPSAFPTGLRAWQVKTGATEPNYVTEIAKDGVQETLGEGRDYVLVWTNDPPDRTALEEGIRDEVRKTHSDRTATLISIEELERFSRVHPGVVEAHSGPHFLGMPLENWAVTLAAADFPFVAEEVRIRTIDAVRDFVSRTDTPTPHLHIFGDTGVGKSRLAYEALRLEGFAERCVVCLTVTEDDLRILERMAGTAEATGIVIADDVDWANTERLESIAAAAGGRIRLLTVGDTPGRQFRADHGSLEVRPLPDGTIIELTSRVTGISSEQAGLVASLAEGYPRLAIELGRALVSAADQATVLDLLSGVRVGNLLNEMIPDAATRVAIAHLALVDRVGYEQGVEYEAEQLCSAFGLPVDAFRAAIDRETGRFVSTVGRYRRATPRALAIWLVRTLIGDAPREFAEMTGRLTPQLFDSFRKQLELLGGDPQLESLLEEVLAQKGDSFRDISTLTPEAAQLLQATSYAIPTKTAAIIRDIVATSSTKQLVEAKEVRRDLVWSLAHLLWFETSFVQAADSLLRLAVAENEDYANNATGTLVGAFGVSLGGTEVPYPTRITWLTSKLDELNEVGAAIAIKAAEAGLSHWESRMGGWRGARLQPAEWKPDSLEAEHEARRAALHLLEIILNRFPELEEKVASALAQQDRSAISRGIGHDLLQVIDSWDWSPVSTSRLAKSLRDTLKYDADGLAPDMREAIEQTLQHLAGETADETIEQLLVTPFWHLEGIDQDPTAIPPVLAEAVDSLLGEKERVQHFALEGRWDSGTQFSLFREIGRRDVQRFHAAISSDAGASEPARVGYVVGRADSGDGEFVEASLMEWSETPTLAAGVPGVTHYLPPSDDAISKPIALVAAGVLPRQTLNRFLLGAWVKGISADSLTKLLSLYDSDDLSAQEAEAGLTMLHFWIDGGRQKPNDSLVAIGVALLRRSGPLGNHSGGLTYARSQMLSELPVLPEQRLDLTIDGLKSRSLTTGSELEVLDQVAGQLPEETVARLVDALLTDTEGWSLWVSRDHLLSRLAETVGANLVTSRLMARTQDEQMRALQHISFLSEEPDPIFLTLLEERTDEEFLNEASVRFLYPGEVVVGSYADYLRGRKRMLESWRDRTESRTLTRWAEDLMPTLDAEIHRNIERETEEEY